ncbi:MAG: hypothetical protein IPN47_20005 [Gemmatimonadetes bacterium]|nr:hypothetical protein [Gemmatimonadota bacterium]
MATSSLAALRRYQSGVHLLQRGDADGALAAFARAASTDTLFGLAALWAAQVSIWSDDALALPEARRWSDVALQRLATRPDLSRESVHAEGLAHLIKNRYPEALTSFQRLRQIDSTHLAAIVGIGDALSRDSVVVSDPSTTSGWRFRTDWTQAIDAYRDALAHAPASVAPVLFRRMIAIVPADAGRGRLGFSDAARRDSLFALPSLGGGTVLFIPYPFAQHRRGSRGTMPSTIAEALQHQRATRFDLARAWAVQAPHSLDARMMFATALESRGDIGGAQNENGTPNALTEIQAARLMVREPAMAAELAATEVRLRLKRHEFAVVRHLADSVLSSAISPTAREARWLVGVAALRGDEARLSRHLQAYWGDAEVEQREFGAELGAPLRKALAAYWSALAIGRCDDSAANLRRTIEQYLDAQVEPRRVAALRALIAHRVEWLRRVCEPPSAWSTNLNGGDHLSRMYSAYMKRDFRQVRSLFQENQGTRRGARASDISWDAVFQEAWLLLRSDDGVSAAMHLDNAFRALARAPRYVTSEFTHAAALVRACRLRLEMPRSIGGEDVIRTCTDLTRALAT